MTIRVPVPWGTVAADVAGPSGAPALVLLHGFTGDRTRWRHLVPMLARERRVVAVDLPGHGDTDLGDRPETATMPVATACVAAVLDHLGIGRATWWGYSMGGRAALAAALAASERVEALVLESASPGLAGADERTARRAADEALAELVTGQGVPAFVARWETQPLFASQATLPAPVRAAVRAQRLGARAAGLAASLRGMGTGAQPWLGDRLAAIAVPVLLLAGARDPKFAALAHALRDALPAATLAVVPDAGHAVHLERPDAALAAVRALLDRIGGDPCRSPGSP